MNVRFVSDIERIKETVFYKNKLQGGYLDLNRGSAIRTGWNSIIGSFMISKSTNNVRIMEKNYEM